MKKRSKLAMLAISVGVALGYKNKKTDRIEPSWFRSVQLNELKEVKRFIAKGQNIHVTNRRGRSALMMATYNHHTELAQLLMEAGADVNQQDDMKNTPYLYAVNEDYQDIFTAMKGRIDGTVTNRYGSTGLMLACERGSIESVRWILANTNTDPNLVNDLGWTALLITVVLGDGSKSYQQIVLELMKAGANPNMADKDGVTPFEHAEKRGYEEISRLLTIYEPVL